jgi:hypothetical protein
VNPLSQSAGISCPSKRRVIRRERERLDRPPVDPDNVELDAELVGRLERVPDADALGQVERRVGAAGPDDGRSAEVYTGGAFEVERDRRAVIGAD